MVVVVVKLECGNLLSVVVGFYYIIIGSSLMIWQRHVVVLMMPSKRHAGCLCDLHLNCDVYKV